GRAVGKMLLELLCLLLGKLALEIIDEKCKYPWTLVLHKLASLISGSQPSRYLSRKTPSSWRVFSEIISGRVMIAYWSAWEASHSCSRSSGMDGITRLSTRRTLSMFWRKIATTEVTSTSSASFQTS